MRRVGGDEAEGARRDRRDGRQPEAAAGQADCKGTEDHRRRVHIVQSDTLQQEEATAAG